MSEPESIVTLLKGKIDEELRYLEAGARARLSVDAAHTKRRAQAIAPVISAFAEIAKAVGNASLVSADEHGLSFNEPENHTWLLVHPGISGGFDVDTHRNRRGVRRVHFGTLEEVVADAIQQTASYVAAHQYYTKTGERNAV